MKAVNFFILIPFLFTSCKAQVNVHDEFEVQKINSIWSLQKLAPEAIEIQSLITRSGKGAAKIKLNKGDMVEAGNDSSKASERAELLERSDLQSVEGQQYSYAFSLFIPTDFPIVDTRLIIAQWKQRCEQGSCEDRSPVIAMRYESGRLFITLQTGAKKQTLWETNEEMRNQWLDLDFNIRFTRNKNGEIAVTLNKKKIINYTGATCYPEEFGFPSKSKFYFKAGLYRDRMEEPMTIYIDEYKKQQTEQ